MKVTFYTIICSSGFKKLYWTIDSEWVEITEHGRIHFFTKKSNAYEVMDRIAIKHSSMKVDGFVMVVD